MGLFENKIGGITNKIGGILNKCLLSVTEVAPSTLGGGTFDPWKRHLRPLEAAPSPPGGAACAPWGWFLYPHRDVLRHP